jgi:outer membrane protein assembly factor BamE
MGRLGRRVAQSGRFHGRHSADARGRLQSGTECIIRAFTDSRFPRMRLRWFALLASIPIAGCGLIYKVDVQQGNLFDKATVDSLKPGMSKRQVLLVMGSPSVVSPVDQDRWDYVSSIRRGRNKMDSKDLTLYFKDDSLVKIDGDYFPEDPEQLIKDSRKYKRQYPDEKRPDEDKDKKHRQGQG